MRITVLLNAASGTGAAPAARADDVDQHHAARG